jgi:NAD dependent epimerase/dehydratase
MTKPQPTTDITRLHAKGVLVTGAGGFIGSHLVEALLKAGAQVRAFVHYNSRNHWGWLEELSSEAKAGVEVMAADLRDYDAVEKAIRGMDIVFHLGALIGIPYSLSYPRDVVDTNVTGSLNVLQASLKQGVSRIIHTSTSEVFGTAQYVPMDENHPLAPQSAYAASKIAADKLAESFHRTYGLPVSILRPFNTFGPRQSLRAVIPTVIGQLLNNGVVEIGDLEPTRDFTFVTDTVNGFLALAVADDVEGQSYNLGTGEEISIKDLVLTIAEILGVDPEIRMSSERVRGNDSEVMQLLSDNSRAREILGWQPAYTLRQGLEPTIDWYRKNQGLFKTDLYNI